MSQYQKYADQRGYSFLIKCVQTSCIHLFIRQSFRQYASINALVISNHGPHPRGIAGTLTFVLQIPAKSPALRGHPVGKTTALFPHSLLCFHCTAMFAYIRQTPGIYPALQGQSKSKNTAKLLPPPPQGVGAVVTND